MNINIRHYKLLKEISILPRIDIIWVTTNNRNSYVICLCWLLWRIAIRFNKE